jgi:2-polyprenyl-3-methyl-5-hydroxy-6-metoxy-1,4-benzoquinol methylase
MNNILTLEEHNERYKQLHKELKFKGYSLKKWIPTIAQITSNANINSILDFGCGEARCWSDFNLKELFDIKKYDLYDPGREEYSVLPDKKYDMVICIDVLEHIPENLLDTVLEQIITRTNKVFFCTISTRLASKILSNGQNAHATVKPRAWWIEKLGKYKDKLIIYYFE